MALAIRFVIIISKERQREYMKEWRKRKENKREGKRRVLSDKINLYV